MSIVYAEPVLPPLPPVPARGDTRTLWLESFDGVLQVPFDAKPVKLLRGAIGLTKPPSDVITSRSPNVPGAFLDEVRVQPRRVTLPLQVRTRTQAQAWEAVARLRAVLRYDRRTATREGVCYLVASSTSGVRRLTVTYVAGLEGEDGGLPNLERFALQLIAVDPYAWDREERTASFFLPDETEAFLSDDPADTWETRSIAASTVFGQGMDVQIASEVPVHPTNRVVGPFGPGFTMDADTGLALSVPDGVPTGSTLVAVTAPRAKSIRLNGVIAGGRIARPWRLGEAFQPGSNQMNVTGPGATAASRILVSWRGGWESMW